MNFATSSSPIAEALKRLRGRITLDEMAEALGVSRTTIVNYESGKRDPDQNYLAAFAEATGADFLELLRLRLASSDEEPARRMAERLTSGARREIEAARRQENDLAELAEVRRRQASGVAFRPVVEESRPATLYGAAEFQRETDWSMLEALLRVCEARLQGSLTADTAAKIDHVMQAWGSAQDIPADLAARMDRIKAGVALLRPE